MAIGTPLSEIKNGINTNKVSQVRKVCIVIV